MLQSIIDIVEDARKKTSSRLKSMNSGLIPKRLNADYRIQDYVTYKQVEYILDNDTNIVIRLDTFKYMTAFNPSISSAYIEQMDMLDAMADNIVMTTMLFINGLHIKQSRIKLTKDNKYTYLIVSDILASSVTDVELIYFPYKVSYFETHVELSDMDELFAFNEAGELEAHGKYSYWGNNKDINIKEFTFLTSALNRVFLDTESTVKLTSDNILVFTNKKLIHPAVTVDAMNVVTISGYTGLTTLKVIYRTDLPEGEDLTDHFPNKTLLKDVLEGTESMPNVNTNLLDAVMDFELSEKTPYDTNIDRAMFYLSTYNSKYLAKVYEEESTIETIQFTGEKIKDLANIRTNRVKMLCLKYKEMETYPIIYRNGLLYEGYHAIEFGLNDFSFPINPDDIDDADVFEIVFFKKVNNYTEEITVSSNHIKSSDAFKDSELLIYTNDDEDMDYDIDINDRSWYTVPFSIANSKIVLEDTSYYGKTLLFTTKNQFRYCYRNIQTDTIKLRLTPDFQGCLNSNQYMVFHNGRLMNKDFYRILLPARDNTFTDPYVYSRIKFEEGDRVDIFYVPIEMEEMKYAQDLTFEFATTTAVDEFQDTFVIPYPFKLYNNPSNFIVMIGSTFVHRSRYDITGGTIKFNDGTRLSAGTKLTFVFSYEKSEAQTSIKYCTEDEIVNMEHNYIQVVDQGQTQFSLNMKYSAYLTKGGTIMVFYKGLYLPESTYQINPTTCVITFLPNTFAVDSYIDIVVCYSVEQTIYNYDTTVTATTNNQTTFDIPTNVLSAIINGDKIMIVRHGTLLIEGVHFTVSIDAGTIVFTKGFEKDDFFSLIAFSTDNGIVRHYSAEFIVAEDNQKVFSLGNTFKDFEDAKSKFLLYIGSVLVDPNRYTINIGANTIVFDDTVTLTKNRLIRLICLYIDKTGNLNFNELGSARYNNLESFDVDIVRDQVTYTIPMEFAAYDHNQFFITAGSIYVSPNDYTINVENNTITFTSNDGIIRYIDSGATMFTFHFIKDDMYDMRMYTQKITIEGETEQGKEYSFTVPFRNYLTLDNPMMVFLNTTYVEPDRYVVNQTTNTIKFPDDILLQGNSIDIVMVYVDNSANINRSINDYSIAKIKPNGYVFMNKTILSIPLYKNLFFLYINGKKIDLDSIIQVSGSIVKVNKDYQSRENIVLLNYTKEMTELKDYFDMYSNLDAVVNNLSVSDMNRLFNANIETTNTEPLHQPNIDTEAFLNEILKDWYIVNNIYNGDEFTYSYEEIEDPATKLGDIFPGVLNSDEFTAVPVDQSTYNNEEETIDN